MSCELDHSREDVIQKLNNQKTHLPAELVGALYHLLDQEQSQALLNEVFHLLKKIDLIADDERKDRLHSLQLMVN